MKAKGHTQGRNRILERVPAEDAERLAPHMERVKLNYKQILVEPEKPIEHAYFVESGVVSVTTELNEGGIIESGTIGNEGFVGVPVLMGMDRISARYIVQIPGGGLRLPVSTLLDERLRGGPLLDLLLRISYAFIGMLSWAVACNRAHAVEQRMCRWLLMTHDRVEAPDFPLTQEFLAQMLGVHRPAVNVAGGALQRAGLIKYSRGRITIVDREGLESASCECYARIKHEFDRAYAD